MNKRIDKYSLNGVKLEEITIGNRSNHQDLGFNEKYLFLLDRYKHPNLGNTITRVDRSTNSLLNINIEGGIKIEYMVSNDYGLFMIGILIII